MHNVEINILHIIKNFFKAAMCTVPFVNMMSQFKCFIQSRTTTSNSYWSFENQDSTRDATFNYKSKCCSLL